MTEVQIAGRNFLVNGGPTYEGLTYRGRSIEGFLFNARMVQAIFDDQNPKTVLKWRYPDTGRWDADRNTEEFCAMLPEYRRYGLLAVTVGLQGGGSIYTPDIYDHYQNSAFEPDGSFRPAYFDRLKRVLRAADDAGMVVIVNYFYWRQAVRMQGNDTICQATSAVTEWLLETGYQNILVDVMNEVAVQWPEFEVLSASGVHQLIEIVQQTTHRGRRLLAGASSVGGEHLPVGRWAEIEDFHMPHGNGCTPEHLRSKLKALKESEAYIRHPRPILINEDSPAIDNLEVAIDEGCSWGYYSQGYGSHYEHCNVAWFERERETEFGLLSGYQTLPVNWGINTVEKRAFFDRIAAVTGSPGRLV
jgi:hypothetical protein